ncbi:MAG: tyrosine-type recombinase/integrase [Planctomycetes bacterium]|nr:tyrosine-type recombinase/integrase [Planctomycetota bacterium]
MTISDTAKDFIDTLRPILRANTCAGYRSSLNHLHTWLQSLDISLGDIDRGAMERWVKSLADRGLAPITRAMYICHARKYLGWLFEKGTVLVHPEDLLRSSDFPKIPTYLPKPFPTEVDRELQRRFRASDTIYGQALLLMRRTGVRIGELIHLDSQCLVSDLNSNTFLKVPLGKLNNERLVPLDDQIRQLVEDLQQKCPSDAPFLLASHISRRTAEKHLRNTLKRVSIGIDCPGSITASHRLRHTYATELLNAGMSLAAIMKLLGHRTLTMTMLYAALTQHTVVNDYHCAMEKIAAKYDLPDKTPSISTSKPVPERMLMDIISWLRNNAPADNHSHRLIKRIYKIKDEIAHLNNRLHDS